MAFGYSHHTEAVTLGTFHGQTLTATVDRYEVRVRILGVGGHWCALRPRAVEAASGAGAQNVAFREGAHRPALHALGRLRSGLGG